MNVTNVIAVRVLVQRGGDHLLKKVETLRNFHQAQDQKTLQKMTFCDKKKKTSYHAFFKIRPG